MIDWSLQATHIAGTIFNIVYIGVIIGTIIVVILDNRNPVKTIAWVLVLMFLPLVGLIFYFFFGRSTRREKLINQKSYDRLLKKPMAAYNAQKPEEVPETYKPLMQFFWETNQSLPFQATEVEIYTNGYSKIKALLRELLKAKHHIHLEYYIFLDDAIGRMIKDTLIQKAKEGVEIRVIYDDVGSWETPNAFYEDMRDAGIEVRSFLKVRFPLFTSRVNYRNHRKIVVIDGETGFIGGMNLAERYVKGFPWGIWRDTHILLRGRAVHGLQTAFLLDWYFVDQTLITSSCYFPRIDTPGSILTQTVTSDPVGPWKEIMQGLTIAITTAKKYVYIQTPYFLPSETILAALQSAALAGIDVRLMIPSRCDNRITQWGSRSYLKDVLNAGVKVYFYKKGFLHSKIMVSDDMLSTVGSTNIDFRSFEHNFEVNAFIYDIETALNLKEVFLQDQRDSAQISMKKWQARPLYQKAIESVVRLLAPLL
ncbi:cardiolipin synthase [Bacteroides sp. 51]|uniref:cardiolipin synthase n=1 Tax=Bacteroides sp. 51 TaxID=2302938 RepID=UPI0013D2E520|nr:cardiolipin synthase [Bacteroides sp. 51]NDV81802.1 cardiolipin synthase [Bacteroides sp. 51]